MPQDPYGPRRKRTPKSQPAIPATAVDDSATTMVRCELCIGCGMVPPEVAALFAATLLAIKAQA